MSWLGQVPPGDPSDEEAAGEKNSVVPHSE